MKYIAWFFLIVFLIATFLNFYNIYKIISFTSRKRGVTNNKIWAAFTAGAQNGSGIAIEKFLVKKDNTKFSKKDMEMIKKRVTRCRQLLLLAIASIVLFIIFKQI